MNDITVLIIDDDENIISSVITAVKTEPNIKLVGTAKNGADGLEMIKKNLPEIILLDIVMPIKDGFSVLTSLNELKIEGYKAKVIVMSSMSNHYEINKSNSLGAVHFMAKPFELCSLISAIKDLSAWQKNIANSPQLNIEKIDNEKIIYTETDKNNIDFNKLICGILDEMHLSPNLKGYTYLKEVLMEKVKNPNKFYSLSKDLYSIVANKYGDSYFCIERSIRTILQKGWAKNKYNNSSLFINSDKCPSNNEFLSVVTKYINNNC